MKNISKWGLFLLMSCTLLGLVSESFAGPKINSPYYNQYASSEGLEKIKGLLKHFLEAAVAEVDIDKESALIEEKIFEYRGEIIRQNPNANVFDIYNSITATIVRVLEQINGENACNEAIFRLIMFVGNMRHADIAYSIHRAVAGKFTSFITHEDGNLFLRALVNAVAGHIERYQEGGHFRYCEAAEAPNYPEYANANTLFSPASILEGTVVLAREGGVHNNVLYIEYVYSLILRLRNSKDQKEQGSLVARLQDMLGFVDEISIDAQTVYQWGVYLSDIQWPGVSELSQGFLKLSKYLGQEEQEGDCQRMCALPDNEFLGGIHASSYCQEINDIEVGAQGVFNDLATRFTGDRVRRLLERLVEVLRNMGDNYGEHINFIERHLRSLGDPGS